MSKKSKKEKVSNQNSLTGNTNREGEGSLYDKIMRENLLELFLPLVAEALNFKFKSVNPLPDKQPTTILRETDAFLLIKTYSETEPEFILHLEFESQDNEEMIYRVMEYHGIELRKYRLPIKHVVVYLGEGIPKMRTSLRQEEIFTGFTLVNTHSFSPKRWLEQEEPAKIIMAILSDYQKPNAAIILEAIVNRLRKVCKTEAELKKFIEQLIIISRMRNLEELTIKISKAMPITIDIEKDYLYKLGLKKGEEIVKQTKAALEAKAKAEAKKVAREKAALEAKAKAEVKKVVQEKAALEAKAKAEARKITQEKAAFEAKAKAEKKTSIQKMQINNLSDEDIMEFLNLDKKAFKRYIKEIKEEKTGKNKGK